MWSLPSKIVVCWYVVLSLKYRCGGRTAFPLLFYWSLNPRSDFPSFMESRGLAGGEVARQAAWRWGQGGGLLQAAMVVRLGWTLCQETSGKEPLLKPFPGGSRLENQGRQTDRQPARERGGERGVTVAPSLHEDSEIVHFIPGFPEFSVKYLGFNWPTYPLQRKSQCKRSHSDYILCFTGDFKGSYWLSGKKRIWLHPHSRSTVSKSCFLQSRGGPKAEILNFPQDLF